MPLRLLVAGSEAPASADMVLASTQQPSWFHALPTKVRAVEHTEFGVACAGTGPTKLGWVTTLTLPT